MSFDGKNQDYPNQPAFEEALRELYKRQLQKNKHGVQNYTETEGYERRLPARFMTQLRQEIAKDAKDGKDARQLFDIEAFAEAMNNLLKNNNTSPEIIQDMMQGLDYLFAVSESELFKEDFNLTDSKWQDPQNMRLLYELFGEISNMSEDGIEDLKAKIKNKNFQKLIQAILSNQLQISQNSNVAKFRDTSRPGSKFTRGVSGQGSKDDNTKNGFSI